MNRNFLIPLCAAALLAACGQRETYSEGSNHTPAAPSGPADSQNDTSAGATSNNPTGGNDAASGTSTTPSEAPPSNPPSGE
jgi:hypothetical protein